MSDFSCFVEADFNAYQPNKWSSNVYNLERLQVKQKLENLGRALSPKLSSSDGPPLGWEVSVEHPAIWNNRKVKGQHLYFLRSPEARGEIQSRLSRGRTMGNLLEDPSPYREHVHLSVSIDHEGLSLSLTLFPDASVDRNNLKKKLEKSWERSLFVDLLSDLPSTHAIQLVSGEPMSPKDDSPDALGQKILEALSSSTTAKEPTLQISCDLAKTDPRLQSPDLLELLQGLLGELRPFYDYIEWRRDNDHLEVFKEIQEKQKERRSKGLSPDTRVRVTGGLWAGKRGVVQDLDGRGQVRVLIGKITVSLKADDIIALPD